MIRLPSGFTSSQKQRSPIVQDLASAILRGVWEDEPAPKTAQSCRRFHASRPVTGTCCPLARWIFNDDAPSITRKEVRIKPSLKKIPEPCFIVLPVESRLSIATEAATASL